MNQETFYYLALTVIALVSIVAAAGAALHMVSPVTAVSAVGPLEGGVEAAGGCKLIKISCDSTGCSEHYICEPPAY